MELLHTGLASAYVWSEGTAALTCGPCFTVSHMLHVCCCQVPGELSQCSVWAGGRRQGALGAVPHHGAQTLPCQQAELVAGAAWGPMLLRLSKP